MAPRLISSDLKELLPMKRSPGNHVSTIIHRMAVAMRLYEVRPEGKTPQVMFEVGNAVELAVADSLKKRFALDDPLRYHHGLEVERDGITGNLDLFDFRDYAVEDVKMTRKSMRHAIDGDKFWYNWAQVKSYCCMVDSRIGRLHVIYNTNNFSEGGGWEYRLWEDEWTPKELDIWWRIMVGHKE